MAIRDRRHTNKSKQITSVADFDVAPPIGGVASRSHDLMFFIEGMNFIFVDFIDV